MDPACRGYEVVWKQLIMLDIQMSHHACILDQMAGTIEHICQNEERHGTHFWRAHDSTLLPLSLSLLSPPLRRGRGEPVPLPLSTSREPSHIEDLQSAQHLLAQLQSHINVRHQRDHRQWRGGKC